MAELSTIVNINDYDISYTEFINWVIECDIDVYAVNANGRDCNQVFFVNLEDFTAFTLAFGIHRHAHPREVNRA